MKEKKEQKNKKKETENLDLVGHLKALCTNFDVKRFQPYKRLHPPPPKGRPKCQFAVLYYGSGFNANEVTDQEVSEFEHIEQSYCYTVPQKDPGQPKVHAENIILSEIKLGDLLKARNAPGVNIYLYTYIGPCRKCTKMILEAADTHADLFHFLIVGFTKPFIPKSSDKDPFTEEKAKTQFYKNENAMLLKLDLEL